MAELRDVWTADRSLMEKHRLAQASYNAGTGHILQAQDACHGAKLWGEIAPCLILITGSNNARQTIDYVERIAGWQREMAR
jgi:membrane-bound lytic murein transglycosylase F